MPPPFPPGRHGATTIAIIAPGHGGMEHDADPGEMSPHEMMLPDDVEIPDDAKPGDVIEVGFRLSDPKARTGSLCPLPDDEKAEEAEEKQGDPQSMSDLFDKHQPTPGYEDED